MKRPRLPALALCLLAACAPTPGPDTFTGYGEARYVYVAAQDAGRIAQALAIEGAAVETGEVLFRLDPQRLELSAASARAEASAAAQRAARAGPLEQAVRQADAEADAAESAFRRTKALYDRGFVAAARLDADAASLRAARAAHDRARAERDAARTETAAFSRSASLAERRVEDLAVPAPAAGVVDRVYRRPGEVVSAGEPLAALITPEGMRVRFFAPEPAVAKLAPGTRLSFRCDGCPDGLTGRVANVATAPQFTPPVIYSEGRREKLVFLIEAIPDNPAAIRPGLPIDVAIAP